MTGHVLQNIISVKRENKMMARASEKVYEYDDRLIHLENILSQMKDIVRECKINSTLSFEQQNDFDNEDFHHGYRSALWCTVRRFEKVLSEL
jgi:hypothetical protein